MNSQSLKSILREMPTREGMKEVLAKLSDESDTTLAIVGATLVETALRMCLRVRMYSDLMPADELGLFEGDGPLATFSSKIRIGFAFEAVDPVMRDELNRLRTIRNAFAHSKSLLSFDLPAIRSMCDQLIMPEVETGAPWQVNGDEVVWVPKEPRDRFIVTVRLCWLFLYQGIQNPPRWVQS